jgi:thiosulfate/3-mercaptopyruvate sulfurtransferase
MTHNNGYIHPEVLVTTTWVMDNLNNPDVRLVEVSVDTTAYEQGHLPGAIGWNWKQDTQDTLVRDIPSKADLEALMSRSGIGNHTTVVLYGDNNNWFATYAFWLLKLYGHEDLRLIDGGRKKLLEEGREMTMAVPTPAPTAYKAAEPNFSTRAFRQDVLQSLRKANSGLVDVRTPGEFSGELLAPPNLPQEGSQRGGHIPGAVNIGWGNAVNEDGTFKSSTELHEIYGGRSITSDKDIIAYCRIGERSSHTWFVLTYLLGYPSVRNYDGSWTEWGSSIGLPVERGA